jgi:hypothetical protein
VKKILVKKNLSENIFFICNRIDLNLKNNKTT